MLVYQCFINGCCLGILSGHQQFYFSSEVYYMYVIILIIVLEFLIAKKKKKQLAIWIIWCKCFKVLCVFLLYNHMHQFFPINPGLTCDELGMQAMRDLNQSEGLCSII